MSKQEQEEFLKWILNQSQGVALIIEPVGKGEYLDTNRLKANKKVYYDRLFRQVGLKVVKEGRFIWNDIDTEFEHYSSSDMMR